jgi:diacylglycerol kinase family enzyme
MGTGNALAHSSGITSDNTLGLSTLARGTPKDLPLLKAAFSPGARLLVDEGSKEEELPIAVDSKPVLFGAVVCSWGLHAGLVADSDTAEYRKHGIKRFAMAANEALFPADGSEPHHYKARVVLSWTQADGRAKLRAIDRDEHGYVLTTLVSNLEKTFKISPQSAPLEGRLRIVHFGHVGGKEAMRIMSLAYQDGKHVEDAAVGYEDVDGIRIEFREPGEDGRWRRVCVDGKIVRVERDGFVEISKWPERVLQLTSLV